ncbi:MAG: FAS1-like dehydratase domain-containing protein, partial [Myxococcota bacterium]
GPHTTQTFTSEWRAYLFTIWGASNYDMASSSTERAGWLPEMTKDFEGGKVDPARTDGLYTGPSRGHTIPKYAQLIGMPRGYGYGASMGAWCLDYLANWAGEWGFVRHSDLRYRGPALTGDVTYLDGEVTDVLHDERDALVAHVELRMTSQRGTRLADGTAEVELPRE